VVSILVERCSLSGGTVIVEGSLSEHPIRVHVGGSKRFGLLDAQGTTIHVALGHLSLINRSPGSVVPRFDQ
jgi:hypothetical protein